MGREADDEITVGIRRGRRGDAATLAALHREADWCYDDAAIVAECYDDAFEPETVLAAEAGGARRQARALPGLEVDQRAVRGDPPLRGASGVAGARGRAPAGWRRLAGG